MVILNNKINLNFIAYNNYLFSGVRSFLEEGEF